MVGNVFLHVFHASKTVGRRNMMAFACPFAGFTCQLLQLHKKLSLGQANLSLLACFCIQAR